MRQLLRLHPDSHCVAKAGIEVEVARPSADSLALSYIVTGKMSDMRMPAVVPTARSDGLWKQTCFEAFVRASSSTEYYEFNFSPSTQWAAYRFSGYRSGMRVATEVSDPSIEAQAGQGRYTLRVSLELDCLLELRRDTSWLLGLSALIEDTSGRKSFWALAHPPGKPDFHHADCFACALSPVVQP